MLNFKIILIVVMTLLATSAFAGTIYLMGIGSGSPGGGGGGGTGDCTTAGPYMLDFSTPCGSQYITVI